VGEPTRLELVGNCHTPVEVGIWPTSGEGKHLRVLKPPPVAFQPRSLTPPSESVRTPARLQTPQGEPQPLTRVSVIMQILLRIPCTLN